MRNIIILLIIFIPLGVLGTGQEPDILIWKGDTLTLFSNPLESNPDIDTLRHKLYGEKEGNWSTACYRLYIGEWEIIEDELYLTNLYSCDYSHSGMKADLKKLFGDGFKNGRVKATWLTGELVIPMGKLIHYVHFGYSSFYEHEIVLTFQNGRLKDQQNYNNSKSHKSVFTSNPKALRQFIYQHIDWEKIPDLKGKEVRVILYVESGKDRKPKSITLVRNADNDIFNQEALRVVRLLPDWDVYYRRGEMVTKSYVIPVIFNEDTRDKYRVIFML